MASDPTVSRLVKTLSQAGPVALRAIRAARAQARRRAWALVGGRAAKTASAAPRTLGLRNLPLHDAANQIRLALVAPATDLTVWAQMLALTGHPAGTWEPKRLRLRIFSAAGRLARGGSWLRLRLSNRWLWADLITTAITRLQMLPSTNRPVNTRKENPGPVEPRPPDATVGPDK
ncbi:hypothetical protein GCM10009527_086680 [Actinomadura nitritigenes]